MKQKPGDILSVPLPNGRTGLAQVIAVRPTPSVAVLDYEGDGVPPAAQLARLRVLADPLGFGGAVRRPIKGGACPYPVVGSTRLVAEPLDVEPWTWASLPLQIYYGGRDNDSLPEQERAYWRAEAREALEKRRGKQTKKPSAIRLPAPPRSTKNRVARLVDDDGVIVAASLKALAQRYATHVFDYDFPKALVSGMSAGELAAFQHETEELVTVHVQVGAPERRAAARPCGRITITDGDTLLVMPYSQFTHACSARQGIPDTTDPELCVRFALPAGSYAATVQRTAESSFRLWLVPGTRARRFRTVPRV